MALRKNFDPLNGLFNTATPNENATSEKPSIETEEKVTGPKTEKSDSKLNDKVTNADDKVEDKQPDDFMNPPEKQNDVKTTESNKMEQESTAPENDEVEIKNEASNQGETVQEATNADKTENAPENTDEKINTSDENEQKSTESDEAESNGESADESVKTGEATEAIMQLLKEANISQEDLVNLLTGNQKNESSETNKQLPEAVEEMHTDEELAPTQIGLAIPKDMRRFVERTSKQHGLGSGAFITEILEHEYSVKTPIQESIMDKFLDDFTIRSKGNVRVNYRIPTYLKQFLVEAASENGVNLNVMLSYFVDCYRDELQGKKLIEQSDQ